MRESADDPGCLVADQGFATLGRVTGEVAHDLRSFFMLLDLELAALRRASSLGSVAMICDQMTDTLRRATTLASHVLGLVRGAAAAREPVELGALTHEVLAVFRPIIPVGVALEVVVDRELPPIPGWRVELERLLLNLILNARDAMPRGGQLQVSVRRGGPAVVLEIADSGVGCKAVPPKGGTSKPNGTGLGLLIVRAVAARHDAALRIDAREGGGTRVVVTFPVDSAP